MLNDFDKSYSELLTDAKKNTLVLNRLNKIAIMMYKCYYKLNPDYVNNMYHIKEVPYNLRDKCKFTLYNFKTKFYGFNSLQYAGVKLWNSLPVHFKTCTDLNNFKKCLNEWKCVNDKCDKCHEFVYHQ